MNIVTAEELIDYIEKVIKFYPKQNALTYSNIGCLSKDKFIISNFKVICGCSKAAFVSKEGDFVCKVNYSGEINSYGDYYDEEEEDPYVDHGFIDYDYTYDYCKVEYDMSNDFIADGFGKFIAKVEKNKSINNGKMVFYTQEKAELFSNSDNHIYTKDSLDKAWDMTKDRYVFDLEEEWIADAIERYGTEEVTELLDYIDEMGINDLHYNNIGYIGDAMVLIDYSGYWDQRGVDMKLKELLSKFECVDIVIWEQISQYKDKEWVIVFEGDAYDVPWLYADEEIREDDGIAAFINEDGKPWIRITLKDTALLEKEK